MKKDKSKPPFEAVEDPILKYLFLNLKNNNDSYIVTLGYLITDDDKVKIFKSLNNLLQYLEIDRNDLVYQEKISSINPLAQSKIWIRKASKLNFVKVNDDIISTIKETDPFKYRLSL